MTQANIIAPERHRLEPLRRRAEARLRRSPRRGPPASVEDTRNLVQDLRVHQVELEMQNEELRRVQLELESSRDRFARLYDLAPVGYLTLDAEGVIQEANLTAAHLLGLDRPSLLKKKLSRFVAPESQDDFYLCRQRAFTKPGPQTCDLQMRRPDGASFVGRLESIFEPAAPRHPARCLVALRDVSERLQAVREQSRLAAIVDSSDDAIISRDLNDVITTWNPGAEQLFGYTAAEIVGRSFMVLVPADRLEETRRTGRALELGQKLAHFDTVRLTKSGRRVWVSCTCSPIKDAGGRFVGTSAILRDVTAQREIEETSRRSEAMLADFFAEAPLGLLWVGADGRVLRVNRAQLEMLGYQGEEVFGRPVSELYAEPEAAAAALERLAKKEVLSNYRARFRHKDGSLRYVLVDANGLWEYGRLMHSRWFVRDVTTLIGLQTELLQIGEHERQTVGHDLHDDLGQHLHGLSYLAGLLEKGLREDASPRAEEAGRLNQYLAQALAMTRNLAHGLQPVSEVPQGLMLALRELAHRTRQVYRVDCQFDCPSPVIIHRHSAANHLYRIAQEAVNNALKHARPTRVRIQLHATGKHIILRVQDNGPGFRQRRKPARGMGLHVMQYRADAINGSLQFQTPPQGGTDVVCTVARQALLLPAA